MKQQEIENKFLDYIEQTLPADEFEQITSLLAQDKQLRKSFETYKKILMAENLAIKSTKQLSPNFSANVFKEIEEKEVGFFRRLFMELAMRQKLVYGGVATLATLVLLIKTFDSGLKDSNYKERTREQIKSAPIEKKMETNGPVVAAQIAEPKNESNKQDEKLIAKIQKDKSLDTAQPAVQIPEEFGKPKGIDPNKISNETDILSELKREAAVGGAVNASAAKAVAPSALRPEPQIMRRHLEKKEVPAGLDGKIYPDSDEGSYSRADQSAQIVVNSEGYTGYTENPRLRVSEEPSSTFSIDVDTASYTNTRRFLKSGQLPPRDSVRIEEFINYFDYNYPVQHEKPFTLSYEIAPSPLEQDRYLLKLGIKAKDASEEIKPWNLVFLVDVSGSMMDSNKLPLVKQSLKILVDKMRTNDKIAIVTYAGSAGVALEPSGINDKSKIIAAIDGLASGGSTNGSGGITAAYSLALKSKIAGGVNRVILATDGDFNVGVTSHDDLIKLIEEKRKDGITLTGLGYGIGNLKDSTLEQLADKGNGNYFYIDSFQEARKVLETDLVGNMEVVAKDVKLQIEFNPEQVSSYRLVGYENRKLRREDFNNDAIDAGEIGTGHTVTAIYEVVLANSELAKTLSDEYRYQKQAAIPTPAVKKELGSELAFLKIRYKEPEGSDSKLLQYPIEAKDVKSNLEQTSGDFKFAAAVSYFGQLLRGSQFVGKYGYKDVLTLAEANRGEDKQGYRQEFIELVKNAQAIK